MIGAGNPQHAGFAKVDGDQAQQGGCDLCGSSESRHLVPASGNNCRIVMCLRCRLMYACPRPTEIELDAVYDQDFTSDAGSRRRAGTGRPSDKAIRR